MKPMFSIIVPVYNVAEYLKDCLESVLCQSFKNWECICVDDGSSDGSDMILDEFARGDNRIVVIHKTNAGVGSARNVGLDCVHGDWVLFLDSDDILATNLLAKICGMIDDNNADLYQFQKQEFSKIFIQDSSRGSSKIVSVIGVLPVACYDRGLFEGCYSSKLLQNLRFTDHVRGEDRLFIIKYLLKCKTVLDCSFVGYGYRLRPDSAMHKKTSLRILCDEVDYRVQILKVLSIGNRGIDNGMVSSFRYNFFNWVLVNQFGLENSDRRQFRLWWLEEIKQLAQDGGLQMLRCPFRCVLYQNGMGGRIAANLAFFGLTYGLLLWRTILRFRRLCSSN